MPSKPPPGRKFTPENAREMQQRSAEARRQAGRTVRQRLAEKIEADADKLYAAFQKAYREGDWRAADAVLTQAFGRPAAELELTLGAGSAPMQVVVESCFALEEPEDADPGVLDAPSSGT
jgi:hypothetical protein